MEHTCNAQIRAHTGLVTGLVDVDLVEVVFVEHEQCTGQGMRGWVVFGSPVVLSFIKNGMHRPNSPSMFVQISVG